MSRGRAFRLGVVHAAAAAAAALTACAPARADLSVERLDVALRVLVDGSLEVEERLRVRFGALPSSEFTRAIRTTRHDGIFAVSGSMDGVAFPRGVEAGRLQVHEGETLDARWTFPPVASATHAFVLNYRAANVVEVSGIRGTVDWEVLAPRQYDVDLAEITLILPRGTVLLDDPWVQEAGWIVTRRPDGLSASRHGISRTESATAGAVFTIDTMAAGEPAWQYHARRARDLMPAFVSSGLFLLVIGAGVIGMMRLKFPPWRVRGDGDVAPAVTPAMAIALERGRCRGDVAEVLAAIRGLDSRTGQTSAAELTAHERVIADERWYEKTSGSRGVALPRTARRRFRRALLDDLIAAGLIDRERATAARDLGRAGIVTMLFGAAAWVFTAVTLDHFGRWPFAVPAGILASGMLFVISAQRFPILSQNGERARARVLYSARVRDGRTPA